MSEFSRPLRGYRLADTLRGDSLQLIARRELGDAARWVDLANINNLLPPYLTDDPAEASERVLLTGSVIIVPATEAASPASASTDPDELYGLDLSLADGDLDVNENGDLLVLDGQGTLRQGLKNRVVVGRGELMFHPQYGCLVRAVIGAVNGPTASVLAAQYVRATLRADSRIQQVVEVVAEVSGDVINIAATVLPITGNSTKIEISI